MFVLDDKGACSTPAAAAGVALASDSPLTDILTSERLCLRQEGALVQEPPFVKLLRARQALEALEKTAAAVVAHCTRPEVVKGLDHGTAKTVADLHGALTIWLAAQFTMPGKDTTTC